MTSLLGRLLNRLGHRLVRWGYALEMRAYFRAVKIKANESLCKGDSVTVDGRKAKADGGDK